MGGLIKDQLGIRNIELVFQVRAAKHEDINNGLGRVLVGDGWGIGIVHPVIEYIREVIVQFIQCFYAYLFRAAALHICSY